MCVKCKQTIQTTAETEKFDVLASRATACFFGGLLCLIGCWPCGLLTACCCTESYQDVWHSCPNCDFNFAIFQPLTPKV